MTTSSPLEAAGQLAVGLLVRASTVAPEPAEVVDTPPPELVTPGTLGFLVTFFAAVAVVLLLRDMVRRNRRIQLRAERRDAERRAGEPMPPRQADPRADGSGPHGGRADPDRR